MDVDVVRGGAQPATVRRLVALLLLAFSFRGDYSSWLREEGYVHPPDRARIGDSDG